MRIFVCLFLLLNFGHDSCAQYRRDIDKELDRLDADVALVVQRSIDYLPIWTENSDSVYINVLDKWYITEVTRVSLVETEIRGNRGGWNQNEILEPVSPEITNAFDLENYMSKALGDTVDNITATIDHQGLSAAITIKVDDKVFYHQQSGGELYLFPVISPDKKYVVFISEMNGLMLVRLPAKKERLSKLDKKLNSGIRWMNKNNCDAASRDFKAVLEIDSLNPCALYNLALCQFNDNALEDLEATLETLFKVEPNNFEATELKASVHYLRGAYEKAVDLCENILSAHPYYYENYYLLLANYEALEDTKQICRVLEAAQSNGLNDADLKSYYNASCK